MVEGPQCNLKARKLAAAGVVGQRVVRAVCPAGTNATTLAARLLSAGAVLRIIAIGKECFCVFQDCALRLHYAMSGSQVIRSGPAAPLPRGSRKVLTLTLELERCAVDLFDCGAPSIRTLGYLANVESRAGRDVIAEEFDRQAVIERLRADTRPAFDALMDQVSFPGVGNVIKCEGLHEAGIAPTILLSELPDARLGILVDVVRAFAQRWHEACRRGVGIAKRVYGATVCACGRQVGLVRAGEKNRITYFCPSCQSREASLTPTIARRGGSLLGWLQHRDANRSGDSGSGGGGRGGSGGGDKAAIALEHGDDDATTEMLDPPSQGAQWACVQCTLLNDAQVRRCAACRGVRPGAAGGGAAGAAVALPAATATAISVAKDNTSTSCNRGSSGGAVGAAMRKRPPSPARTFSETTGRDNSSSTATATATAPPPKRHQSSAPTAAAAAAAAVNEGGLRLASPGCRCSASSKLQRVRKAGPNHGRLFWYAYCILLPPCPAAENAACFQHFVAVVPRACLGNSNVFCHMAIREAEERTLFAIMGTELIEKFIWTDRSCPKRQGQSCGAFIWADGAFLL